MRTIVIGRFMVTTTRQGGGAPLVDDARTVDRITGREYRSLAIVPPWRLRPGAARSQHCRSGWRTEAPCRALVVGRAA